ncbi:hypothetical protein BG910_04765 [Neisseria chenwenguii]|uniref:Uncharacterized protein n=1 Tax=Neisseria chenwenguii TaxID=1853278 RepID=A0A220S158_9NEIS|nr:hypothetical protein [Neisseria chenwenguii]ASK27142.1 hypothetical protein BG910_04765 [Neisseria chenwenguii]
MSDLDDFIKTHGDKLSSGKRSVLEPYKGEILKMKQLGFAEKLILQFLLEKKNVTVSQQALNRFIRTRLKKPDSETEKLAGTSNNVNQLTKKQMAFSETEKPAIIPEQPLNSQKFDWQKPINPEEMF